MPDGGSGAGAAAGRLAQIALAAARALPRAAEPLDALVGRFLDDAGRAGRRTAHETIATAFPELDASQTRRLARDSRRGWRSDLVDLVRLARRDPAALCSVLTLDRWERIAAAETGGRGVVLLTAPSSCWPLLAPVVALYKRSVSLAPATTPACPAADAMRELAVRHGARIAPADEPRSALLAELAAGGLVLVVVAPHSRPGAGVEARFLSRPAWVPPLAAELSLAAEAPVVPLLARRHRRGRGRGYRVTVDRAIEPSGAGEVGVAALTALYLAALERQVRRAPEEWPWHHRRP